MCDYCENYSALANVRNYLREILCEKFTWDDYVRYLLKRIYVRTLSTRVYVRNLLM